LNYNKIFDLLKQDDESDKESEEKDYQYGDEFINEEEEIKDNLPKIETDNDMDEDEYDEDFFSVDVNNNQSKLDSSKKVNKAEQSQEISLNDVQNQEENKESQIDQKIDGIKKEDDPLIENEDEKESRISESGKHYSNHH
jgi:hypothetical protein